MPDIKEERTQVNSDAHLHINNTNEHVVQEFMDLRGIVIISADLSLITKDLQVKVQERTDGVNYRIKTFKTFPTDFRSGQKTITPVLEGTGNDIKLTFQSPVAEGSDKNVPLTIRVTTPL